jgi:hypothetical protein
MENLSQESGYFCQDSNRDTSQYKAEALPPERQFARCETRSKLQPSELPSYWTLSIVRYSKTLENKMFRELDLFPSSGRGGGGNNTKPVGSLRNS